MMEVPVYPKNSIYIPVVQTGCMKSEFDSTYRINLIGIISPDEFQESMKKINQPLTIKNNLTIICFLIVIFSLIVGTICLMVGAARADAPDHFTINVPLCFAIILYILLFISLLILVCIVPISLKRTQEVIDKESLKYSLRLPIPCYWTLDFTSCSCDLRSTNNMLFYRIVIDIGPSVSPVHNNPIEYPNKDIPIPELFFERQDVDDPPPYPDSNAIFCSQCSVPRRDSTAKFCSSCGQPFDEY